MRKIILLVDFTGVSQLAMEHVAIIAGKCHCQITLLHIAHTDQKGTERDIIARVKDFAKLLENKQLPYSIAIDFGDFFETISNSINKLDGDLIVVGTHAISGPKQNFAKSNILRLIQLIRIPALVVQLHSETPQQGYNRILIPLLPKPENVEIARPLANFASVFNSTVHFMAFHNVVNEAEMADKAKNLASIITEQGIVADVDTEKMGNPAGPHARSIIEYSDIEDAQLIGIVISHGSAEQYFNLEDSENILLNRLGKPVLCF